MSALRSTVGYAVQIVAKLSGRDSLWASLVTTRMSRAMEELVWGTLEFIKTFPRRRRMPPISDNSGSAGETLVDRYWGSHTVRGRFFFSKQDSIDHIVEITDKRPLKRELLKLHGPHAAKTILDYGCGPGNDLAGFAEESKAVRIIGVDISRRALEMARARLSWHEVDPSVFTFIRISDKNSAVPLPDHSVDYIQSLGVIHHTSNPNAVFKELARLLKRDGEMRIMLYNADSVHVQLSIGYLRRLVQGIHGHITPEQSFQRTADLEAPIAHCVRSADVEDWIGGSGLKSEFLGGYFMPGEIENYRAYRERALADGRLSPTQRSFIEELIEDGDGYPLFQEKPAGLGAVYRLWHAHPIERATQPGGARLEQG